MRYLTVFLRLCPFFCLSGTGCGSSYLPPAEPAPPSSDSTAKYPIRTDYLVLERLPSKNGLEGTPKRWNSPGYPPLRSARNVNVTPDRDIGEDLRLQMRKNLLDPTVEMSPQQAMQLGRLLLQHFGTPAQPRVDVPDWNQFVTSAVVRLSPSEGVFANLGAAAAALASFNGKVWKTDWDVAISVMSGLQLDQSHLARGSVLYRRWCMQCHGVSGAGDGAHAINLAAMPRDYRQGIFKFISAMPEPGQQKKGLGASGKPRREDIVRAIREGIDGSMMPAFPTLTESELNDLTSYVIHLAVRGETEFVTLAQILDENSEDYGTSGLALGWLMNRNLVYVLYNWGVAARSAIPIPPEHTPTESDWLASAIRGAKRYTEYGCGSCHQNFGREPQLKWDRWGTIVQPRNLLLGVYRGGRKGQDLYSRIYGGVYPSGMTAHFDRLANVPQLPDQPDQIWDIVHFLQALADPKQRALLKQTDPSLQIDP